MNVSIDNIFNIKSEEEFNSWALDVFKYQVKENEVYNKYLQLLKFNPSNITTIESIPFLPIEFFKNHKVVTGNNSNSTSVTFSSSGTTGTQTSKHFVSDVSIYEKSFRQCFEFFYGNPQDYCILALLPSYLQREGSSLIYMVEDLIKSSKHPQSSFYLNEYEVLYKTIQQLLIEKKKILLIGVTYALLDFVEYLPKPLTSGDKLIVMETGGMKGKRKEMVREELHKILIEKLGVDTIHSEYGMTELLSQAYSKGNGVFYCPPWMQVIIRQTNDPLSFANIGKSGGINIIDLASINSCSFIATQDLGKKLSDDSFEVIGRFDNSDLRGCNLLVE